MSRTRRNPSDLFIRFQCVTHDTASRRYYHTPELSEPRWVVNCRNPRTPHRTSLPVGFATLADAQRAAAALVAAGLGDTQALHQRIKKERNWESVRRVMIEALSR